MVQATLDLNGSSPEQRVRLDLSVAFLLTSMAAPETPRLKKLRWAFILLCLSLALAAPLNRTSVALFGPVGAADNIFAPVITRFETYGVEMDDICRTYAHNVMTWRPVEEWCEAAKAEPWIIEKYESA